MNNIITSKRGGKIIVVLGPTASGKSEFAVRLAKKFNGEIISVDSRQVYRYLNIGTGKVEGMWEEISNIKYQISKQIQNQKSKTKKYFVYKDIIHHCIDFVNPKKVYSAGEYIKHAKKALLDISSRGKISIICGGTGFYIDALLGNIKLSEGKPDWELRKKIKEKECCELFLMLQKLNPKRAKSIDKNNKRRLIRAIEIELSQSRKLGFRQSETEFPTDKNKVLYIGIYHPSEILKERVEKRLVEHLNAGMIEETRDLRANKNLSWKRIDDLGLEYRYISYFLRGKTRPVKNSISNGIKSKEELFEKLKLEIWHYAKRQMTWFKRNKNIHWIDLHPKKLKKAEILIKKFLAN